jgi:Recombinase
MANLEHIREAVKGPIDSEYIRRRQAQGWKLVAVEWEVEWQRESAGAPEGAPAASAARTAELSLEEPPFGFQVAPNAQRLAENPSEMEFLLSMMELIIQDISLSKVAEELNRKGFKTRKGGEWGPVSVFNMLPRLIELTPRIFASAEWIERRKRLTPLY